MNSKRDMDTRKDQFHSLDILLSKCAGTGQYG